MRLCSLLLSNRVRKQSFRRRGLSDKWKTGEIVKERSLVRKLVVKSAPRAGESETGQAGAALFLPAIVAELGLTHSFCYSVAVGLA